MRYRTICRNKEFSRLYNRGKSYVHPQLVMYVGKNRLGYTRIGLTATKKVGGAVQRNRARRVMRAALAEHLSQNIGGYDIILVARGQTPNVKSTRLSQTLAKLMHQAGLPDKAAGETAVKNPPAFYKAKKPNKQAAAPQNKGDKETQTKAENRPGPHNAT